MARKLASLAQAWVTQNENLRVRQREQLRRALAAAAEFQGWAMLNEDRVETAVEDVAKLTAAGTRSITRDLATELADKKTEMTRLKKVASSIQKLAERADFDDPIEISYCHTARNADGLITKTEVLTLTDAQEAADAVNAIDKKFDRWGRLREEMVEELKHRQKKLEEGARSLSDFVESSRSMVTEVFAILY